jgi:hypothetical protein
MPFVFCVFQVLRDKINIAAPSGLASLSFFFVLDVPHYDFTHIGRHRHFMLGSQDSKLAMKRWGNS